MQPIIQKTKKIKHEFVIEDEDKLRIRLGLEKKIKIKEYEITFKIDTIVKGMRLQTKSRFKVHPKE